MAFKAKYSGTCKGCGQSFPKGTSIDLVGDGRLTYHVDCKPQLLVSAPTQTDVSTDDRLGLSPPHVAMAILRPADGDIFQFQGRPEIVVRSRSMTPEEARAAGFTNFSSSGGYLIMTREPRSDDELLRCATF